MKMEQKSEISAARYRGIRDLAGRVLIKHTDGLIPIKPLLIIRHSQICIATNFAQYESTVLRSQGIKAVDYFQSQDGCTQYHEDSQTYIVFYNGELILRNPWRLNWTLAHEIGHIVLGHLERNPNTSICGVGITLEEHELYEREADYFASMLLAHPAILWSCHITAAEELQRMFGLSAMAAENRLKSFQASKALPSTVDYLVNRHFSRVIERINLPFAVEPNYDLYPW
jgi:Zn-dependent peptidase ImmA (M78 family)